MAIVDIECINIELPDPPPVIEIPHFGELQAAWGALGKIPDPGEILSRLQDTLAIALAPVRRFLELVEVIFTIKDCITAIPNAIMRLSPSPIFDCLENLAKTIARIAAWFPPLAYISLALGILNYCITLIDEILRFFTALDDLLTDYVNSFNIANLFGDEELIAIVNCGLTGVRPTVITVMDLLTFIKPINDVLMEVFARMMPSKAMQQAVKQYNQSSEYHATALSALRSGSGQTALPTPPFAGYVEQAITQSSIIPIPPLSPMLHGINESRNAMVTIYNFLAPVIGQDPSKTTRDLPTFNHF